MSKELIAKANAVIESAALPDRHTYFQIEKFIIGKEPTAQGQLWQIVRELKARRETVDSLSDQLIDAEDELELFDVKIEQEGINLRHYATSSSENGVPEGLLPLEVKRCEINIRKLTRQKEALIKSARIVRQKLQGVMEEMKCLLAGYDKVYAVTGCIKDLDDAEAQREYWNEKLLEEFNLRVLLKRPFDPEFVKTVLALNNDSPVRKQVVSVLQQLEQQVNQPKLINKPSVQEKAKNQN